jgi:hypothetical protein
VQRQAAARREVRMGAEGLMNLSWATRTYMDGGAESKDPGAEGASF